MEADLYILLDVFGEYWSYPSWRPLAEGLDHDDFLVPGDYQGDRSILPGFDMPTISPAGPLYFYAAMFADGQLDEASLISNASIWEFSFE